MIQLKMYSRYYDGATYEWVNQNMYIKQDCYYTTDPGTLTPTSTGNTPSLPVNKIGEPETVTFTFTQNFNDMEPDGYDRIILETTSIDMEFAYPLRCDTLAEMTTATSGEVVIYPGCKWIEITPTAVFPQGSTSVTLQRFKNMPYYNTGIDFRVYPWIQGDVKQISTFLTTAVATWQDI
eukprot:TRINITY_DN16083_c0_g1_i1.p2 TRINITY_DN16083_c0_g1~~TRINITY_DN16083_c0_g1_i1.p2  ORF type:complete len:179 (-),score=20.38 TRINITY_DN16083_c0_g1_i1:1175-1711(-)